MDRQPAASPGLRLVQAYAPGSFTIAGSRYETSLLVLPGRVLAWEVPAFDSLTLESLAPLQEAADRPELLLLGTGARHELVPEALRRAVRAWGPVVEAMTTPAACRTYNVLLAEGRRVAAALILLP